MWPFQVMASLSPSSSREKISIPFQPLLDQITDCLDFPRTTYSVDDPVNCKSCVYIRTEGQRGIFWFNGKGAATIEDSKESAAERAMHFLIKRYDVCVGDFTMDRMRMYDLCGKLYKLKRNSLESRGRTKSCSKKIVGDILHVVIDYVAFLPKIIRHTGVLITGLETVYSEGQGYVSWLTLYNLDIVDANYGSALFKGVLCFLEMESCLAVEERKNGHKDNVQLMPLLIEENSSTLHEQNPETFMIVPGPSTPGPSICKRPSWTSVTLETACTSRAETSTPSVVPKRIREETSTPSVGIELMSRRLQSTSKRRRAIAAMSWSNAVSSHNQTDILGRELGAQQLVNEIDIPAATIGMCLPTGPAELAPPYYCSECNAKKFEYETLHFCCGNGEIQIDVNEYPLELKRLFTSDDEDALHFKKYARLYNNLFAFSSLGGNYGADSLKGIYLFKGHGQMYHFVPDLLPADGKAKYLQLYFYDGQHETANRTNSFPEVREDIVSILMNVTKENPYARFFRSLREIPVEESTTIILNTNTVPDQRVYNAPTADEVAGIWPDNSNSTNSSSPHIVVQGKSSESHRIQHYYGCYDPLQYPLLFPREELLAEEESRAARRNTKADKYVSAREYYAYKFQIRDDNMLLRAGRCLQQYIVDMYVKVDNTRLDFFCTNQDTTRADLYQDVLDSLDCGLKIAANVGRRVVLPPTYIGGPRDMQKRYFNAIALVQRFGKPDLFVTMTCNANWPEIKDELGPNKKAQDRPDLVARIFHAKLIALKKEIKEKKCFGEVAAMIFVVEFQKRGLPHAHFLIILKPEYKLRRIEDYDKFVSAELPPTSSPALRKILLRHMMHGPCGSLNPKCACMRKSGTKESCKYGYLKQFCDETVVNKEGYPFYRHKNTGESVRIRNAKLDNRWFIPYNPYLSLMFNSHINVEVCSTIRAVKYLYKYVYKGHDRIQYNIVSENNVIDEIKQYQSGIWVSPCEAAWRIFGFDFI
ncbi:uncharacterized protein LOC110734832 [Chenopodium quinoa]|uniref:uncharacterized protein LOC110734832 n=1 Tax=Chenopodium quinoa TaxID=63459 RepID=UPI000B781294|nr:uncharacterized protein LOC110734832 [Chenopodium quinoa]